MEKRYSHSYNLRNPKKINTELFQKIKNDKKIKEFKKNNFLLNIQKTELITKKDKLFNHFNSVNNYLLHYIADLDYKINKNTYNPDIMKKEEDIVNNHKINIKNFNKYQDFRRNKLIDDKYLLENKAVDCFKKEEEREYKFLKEQIKKDKIVLDDLSRTKDDLSHYIKKFRKQIVKTENNENKAKDLKLKLDLTKGINLELNNILNKEKKIQKKLLYKEKNIIGINKDKDKEEIDYYSYREKNRIKTPILFKEFILNNNNTEYNNITPRKNQNQLYFNKKYNTLNINSIKSKNKPIIINSSKKNRSRNNYISTTIGNSTERNKPKVSTIYLSEDKDKEKKDIKTFCNLIEKEVKNKKDNIKIIYGLINKELQIQYHMKNLLLECIKDLNKINKDLNIKKKFNNINDKNNINEQIKENEKELNIINYIFEKCFK